MLDLSSLEGEKTRWVELGAPLHEFEVKLRHRTMKERERFRVKLQKDGILGKDFQINTGRMESYIAAMVPECIIDWKVPEKFRAADSKDENPKFVADELAKLLNISENAMTAIGEALADEAGFFTETGNGSQG